MQAVVGWKMADILARNRSEAHSEGPIMDRRCRHDRP
jgi:hypothetical protein